MCLVNNPRRRSSLITSGDAEILFSRSSDTWNSSNNKEVKSKESASPLKAEAYKTHQKHCVQHNYHDHSSDSDPELTAEKTVFSKGGVTVPFPTKLHDMLEHIEFNEPALAEIVSWQPHGRCFLVRSPKRFANEVLTRFFQQKKYASFQRQLNLYGFNRITKGPDRGSYYHECFLRGKKFLCRSINRMKIKGTGARMASNPDAEPNFYSMPFVGPRVDSSIAPKIASAPIKSDVASVKSEESISVSPMPPLNPDPIPSAIDPRSSFTSASSKSSDGSAMVYATHEPMPPLTSSSMYSHPYLLMAEKNHVEDVAEHEFGMPFHSIEIPSSTRRHSLLFRRNSLLTPEDVPVLPYAYGPSFLNQPTYNQAQMIDDEEFYKEMDLISSLGNSSITDKEMSDILDKIIQ